MQIHSVKLDLNSAVQNANSLCQTRFKFSSSKW